MDFDSRYIKKEKDSDEEREKKNYPGEVHVFKKEKDSDEEREKKKYPGEVHVFKKEKDSGEVHVFKKEKDSGEVHVFKKEKDSGEVHVFKKEKDSGEVHVFKKEKDSGEMHVLKNKKDCGEVQHVFKKEKDSDEAYVIKKEKGSIESHDTSEYSIDDDIEVCVIKEEKDSSESHISEYTIDDDDIGENDMEVYLNSKDEDLDFEPSPLHKYGFVQRCSNEMKENFLAQGIEIRTGKWIKEEDCVLHKNWNDFIAKYPVKNPTVLLYTNHQNKCSAKLSQFIAAKNMYVRLAKGLNGRTLCNVLSRARKIIDPTHSNQCFRSYSRNLKQPKKGPWTSQEEQQLIEALKVFVGIKTLTSGSRFNEYPWEKIAELVSFRSDSQCKEHWIKNLCWKPDQLNLNKWSKMNDAILIYKLYAEMAEKEEFVDWDALYKHFQPTVNSYYSLKQHFGNLKSKVPNCKSKDFEDIIVYLYRRYLPNLLKEMHLEMHHLTLIANGADIVMLD